MTTFAYQPLASIPPLPSAFDAPADPPGYQVVTLAWKAGLKDSVATWGASLQSTVNSAEAVEAYVDGVKVDAAASRTATAAHLLAATDFLALAQQAKTQAEAAATAAATAVTTPPALSAPPGELLTVSPDNYWSTT